MVCCAVCCVTDDSLAIEHLYRHYSAEYDWFVWWARGLTEQM